MAALLGENKGKTLSLSALAAAASDRVWQCCPLSWQPGLAVASLQGWLNRVGWLCRWPKGALCLGCGGSSRKGRCVCPVGGRLPCYDSSSACLCCFSPYSQAIRAPPAPRQHLRHQRQLPPSL